MITFPVFDDNMYIDSIGFKNILTYENEFLNIDKLNFIVGPNNSGKTNLLRALSFVKKIIDREKNMQKQIPKEYQNIKIEEIIKENDIKNNCEINIDFRLEYNEIEIIEQFLSIYNRKNIDNAIRKLSTTPYKDLFEKEKYNFKEAYISIDELIKKEIEKILIYICNQYSKYLLNQFFNNSITYTYNYIGKPTITEKQYFTLSDNKHILKDQNIEMKSQKPKMKNFHLEHILTNDLFNNEKLMKEIVNLVLKYKGNKKPTIKEFINITKYLKDFINNPENTYYLKFDFTDTLNYSSIPGEDDVLSLFPENINRDSPFMGSINLFKLICRILNNYIILSDTHRKHSFQNNLISNTIVPLRSDTLPMYLFNIKNSPYKDDLFLFNRIKNKFFELTKLEFDVIQEYKEIKNEEMRHVVSIMIRSDNYIAQSISSHGSGIFEILYYITVLHVSQNKLLLLDEPALNLHPKMQRNIFNYINQNKHNNQYIIITHSQDLLPDLTLEYLFNIYYFSKNRRDNNTLISLISPDIIMKTKRKFIKTINRNRQVLFTDIVIVTEGLTDYYYFRRILDYYFKETIYDIDIIWGRGEGSPEVYKILKKWNIITLLIIDHDKKDILKRDKNVSHIPADIEGLILVGNTLYSLINIFDEQKIDFIPRYEKYSKFTSEKIRSMKDELQKYLKSNDSSILVNMLCKNSKKITLDINMISKDELVNSVQKDIENIQYCIRRKYISEIKKGDLGLQIYYDEKDVLIKNIPNQIIEWLKERINNNYHI